MKALALLVALAVAGAAIPAAASAQRVDRNLRLPPGWDDAFFERLDEGRSPRTVVAVMDFAGGEVLEERLRFRMADMLITALVRAGRFDVVERERLDAILTEQELQQSGNVDPATAAMVGRLLGAELVVSGVVTRAADQLVDRFSFDEIRVEVAVDVRAVHTTSGRVVISETAEGSASDRIITTASGEIVSGPTSYDPLYLRATAAAVEAAGDLVSTAAPLIGFVISVSDRDVVIDLGESRGVGAGESFVVFRRGEALVHPVSGERIGWSKTVLAAIEIVAVEANLSTGRIVSLAERGVELLPGDLVIFRPAER